MMKRLLRILVRWPTERALLVACVLGLLALAIMVAGILLATPLPVVASMSVAQGIGVLACLLFGLSVAAEVAQRNPER
jgi:hypothetical protein